MKRKRERSDLPGNSTSLLPCPLMHGQRDATARKEEPAGATSRRRHEATRRRRALPMGARRLARGPAAAPYLFLSGRHGGRRCVPLCSAGDSEWEREKKGGGKRARPHLLRAAPSFSSGSHGRELMLCRGARTGERGEANEV
jgi:hypothetical protein